MWEICGEARRPAGQDPDVVGLGILIAFAGSAGVAIVGLVIQYLFFYVSPAYYQPCTNPVDALLLGTFRGFLRSIRIKLRWLDTPWEDGVWRQAFARCILAFGDIQLAMGAAALAYAYVTAFTEVMSVYHWWLIVGLVWFSVLTNLATAAYLRTQMTRNSGERGWRTLLLVILFAALIVTTSPMIRIREALANDPSRREDILSRNVLCYLPEKDMKFAPHSQSAGILLAIVFGTLIVVSVILKLYQRRSSIIYKWREHYRGEMQHSLLGDVITCLRCEQRFMLLVVRPILALWLVIRIYIEMLNSILIQIFCIMATYAWVAVRLIDIRGLDTPESARWTFGQILALALFAAPFASFGTCLWNIRLARKPKPQPKPKPQQPSIRERLPRFKWPRLRRSQTEPLLDSTAQSGEPASTPAEADDQGAKASFQTNGDVLHDRVNPEEESDLKKAYDVAYRIFPSPWFVISLPLVAFPSLLQLVLLLALTNLPEYPTPAHVLWKTIFWYLVYQPALLFMFMLAGMIVEERVRRRRRLLTIYGTIATIALALSAAAIFDTLYGLGGIPMSYLGMGAVGLVILLYILYGLVARPSPMAKGKGRRLFRGDLEEGRPLLGGRRATSDIRIPVSKRKRWHGPSRRPEHLKRKSYGTIEDSGSSAAARTS